MDDLEESMYSGKTKRWKCNNKKNEMFVSMQNQNLNAEIRNKADDGDEKGSEG